MRTVDDPSFYPFQDEEALRALYDRLRLIARARLAGNYSISPTSLVNEAISRLLAASCRRGDEGRFTNEDHFIAACCEAMRFVLVDHVRRKSAGKRMGGAPQEALQSGFELKVEAEAILDLNRELDWLTTQDHLLGQLVEMRVFAGLTFVEIGALLNLPTKTAERRWRYATALLRGRLSEGSEPVPVYEFST